MIAHFPRRAILAGAGAAVAVPGVAAPAAASTGPDAALFAAVVALRQHWQARAALPAEPWQATEDWCDREAELLTALPLARSPAGVLTRIAVLLDILADGDGLASDAAEDRLVDELRREILPLLARGGA